MTAEQGTTCPECGAPRGPDNTPSCDCTERAAAALREARTAEAAAAEDFDPLRIRPYVEMPDTDAGSAAVRPEPFPAVAHGPRPAATTERLPAVAESAPSRHRFRRPLLLAAAGTGVAIVAAAGFALFSYQAPARDRAAQEVRESIPEATTRAPAPPTPPAPPLPPRRTAAPSPATPTPTPTPTSPSPSPTPSASPSGPPSPTPSAPASGTPRTTPAMAPVLRRGDTGPEVTELQQRLRQLHLYGDRPDGIFSRPVEDAVRTYQRARGITGDALGTYGPATRRSLESETTEP